MSDINPDLVAQEVDDELRRERMTALWKSYGRYIIGGAVGIVLVVAGREIYDWRVSTTESKHSEAFAAAIEAEATEGADGVALWSETISSLGDGYASLARFRLADAALTKGNVGVALQTYDAIATDNGVEDYLQDLATLKAAMLLAGRQGELETAKARLATIAQQGNTWYFSALEQMAVIELQLGDTESALTKYTILVDHAETPVGIQARARQFRDFLEGKQRAQVAIDNEMVPEEASSIEGDSK